MVGSGCNKEKDKIYWENENFKTIIGLFPESEAKYDDLLRPKGN